MNASDVNVKMARLPFQTRLFNANQKVWVQFETGHQAFAVTGRHRGSGRWIRSWVKWGTAGRQCPDWRIIQVSAQFAERHQLRTYPGD